MQSSLSSSSSSSSVIQPFYFPSSELSPGLPSSSISSLMISEAAPAIAESKDLKGNSAFFPVNALDVIEEEDESFIALEAMRAFHRSKVDSEVEDEVEDIVNKKMYAVVKAVRKDFEATFQTFNASVSSDDKVKNYVKMVKNSNLIYSLMKCRMIHHGKAYYIRYYDSEGNPNSLVADKEVDTVIDAAKKLNMTEKKEIEKIVFGGKLSPALFQIHYHMMKG